MTYSVYIGNLPTTISTEQLTNLFSQVGQIVNVWINPSYEKITYGFIEFTDMASVKKACKQFNDLILDFCKIKVNSKKITPSTKKVIVYVGNLPTTISTEKLTNLFSQVGEILDVWINPLYEAITYGFIKFSTELAAQNACEQFNNLQIDYSHIKVNIKETELNYRENILLELPKKTGVSKNHLVKVNLLKTLRRNKDIQKDFVLACQEMEDIPNSNEPHIIKTAPEPSNLTTLETTVTRYFKPTTCKKDTEVDFDLSKGKLLTNEQHEQFFNVQFTKPQPVAAKQITKKRPFAFDCRTISDDFF